MSRPWREEVSEARSRAVRFFESLQHEEGGHRRWRHSPVHDPGREPGLLLHGTWAGVFASRLLGTLPPAGHPALARTASALQAFQVPDGSFTLPGYRAGGEPGHSAEYDRFHWTNYAWGAMRELGVPPAHPPVFLHDLLTPAALGAWLAARDLARPWSEGNTVVNLGSFLELLAEGGHAAARELLVALRDWHVAHQDPRTGYWHSRGRERTAAMEYAMAGAAHNLHLFHHAGIRPPNPERMIDSCLSLPFLGVTSACIDLDTADLLGHLRGTGHRTADIDARLLHLLGDLLLAQNTDGGFCDNYVTAQETYGCRTPPGVSVGWTTWFRMATIGMIACALDPAEHARWSFRATLGSGYFRPDLTGATGGGPAVIPAPRRALVAGRRRARWARQRLTHAIRHGWRDQA